jgi:hypothetical protein
MNAECPLCTDDDDDDKLKEVHNDDYQFILSHEIYYTFSISCPSLSKPRFSFSFV